MSYRQKPKEHRQQDEPITDHRNDDHQKINLADIVTARNMLFLLGLVGIYASFQVWYPIQAAITTDLTMAFTTTLLVVLGPPVLTAFWVPWSPGARLLQKVSQKTLGYGVLVACSIILIYYQATIQWYWWSAQATVVSSGIVLQQVVLHLVGTIFVPALVIAPVSKRDMARQIYEQRQVEEFEIHMETRRMALLATQQQLVSLAMRGLSNLTASEQHELAAGIRAMSDSMDATLAEMRGSVGRVSGVTLPLASVQQRPEMQNYFEAIDRYLDLPPGTAEEIAVEKSDTGQRPGTSVESGSQGRRRFERRSRRT